MYEYLHDTFKTAYGLARKWREEFDKKRGPEGIVRTSSKELTEKYIDRYYRMGKGIYTEEEKAKKELREYLSTLDHKTLKILIEIMYLGRDGHYEEEHGTEETFINRMTEKWPLSEYWEKGFEHLGIDIR